MNRIEQTLLTITTNIKTISNIKITMDIMIIMVIIITIDIKIISIIDIEEKGGKVLIEDR